MPDFKDVLFTHLSTCFNDFLNRYYSEGDPLISGVSMLRKEGVNEFISTLLRYSVSIDTKDRILDLKKKALVVDAGEMDQLYNDAAVLASDVLREYRKWARLDENDDSDSGKQKIIAAALTEIRTATGYLGNALRSDRVNEPQETSSGASQIGHRDPTDFAKAFDRELGEYLRCTAEKARKTAYHDAVDLQTLDRAGGIFPSTILKWWRLPKATIKSWPNGQELATECAGTPTPHLISYLTVNLRLNNFADRQFNDAQIRLYRGEYDFERIKRL